MAVTRDQQVYQIRTDATAAQGGTPVWAVAQNTVATPPVGIAFRIRFAIANTGTTSAGTGTYNLYVSQNGGAYIAVPNTASTNPVYQADATAGASADNSAISTSLLTGATGVFQNGQYDFNSGTSSFIITTGNYTEIEFAIRFQFTYIKNGDTFAFRVQQATNVLETYTQTPTLTIVQIATQEWVTQASLEEWAQQTFVPPQAIATQVLLEEWTPQPFIPPQMRVTQVSLEEWVSVTSVAVQEIVTQVLLEEWTSTKLTKARRRVRVMA